MKKLSLKIIFIAIFSLIFTGCASSPVIGGLYTNTKHSGYNNGGIVDGTAKATKTGMAECESILYAFAFGDCTVNTAMNDGNITKVHSVQYEATNIYFFYSSFTTIVKGE